MSVIRIKNFIEADFAGTRETGEKIRLNIEKELPLNEGVTLDFALIEMITQSFADEIIGILVRLNGAKYVATNIRLVNANKDIIETINFVIKYSARKHREVA